MTTSNPTITCTRGEQHLVPFVGGTSVILSRLGWGEFSNHLFFWGLNRVYQCNRWRNNVFFCAGARVIIVRVKTTYQGFLTAFPPGLRTDSQDIVAMRVCQPQVATPCCTLNIINIRKAKKTDSNSVGHGVDVRMNSFDCLNYNSLNNLNYAQSLRGFPF